MQIHEHLRGPTLCTKAPQIVLRFHALGQRSANSSDCSSWTPTPNSSNRSHLKTQIHFSSEMPTVASDELGSLRETALLTASSTGLTCNLCGSCMTLHSEGILGEKTGRGTLCFGQTGPHLVTQLPQEKVQSPPDSCPTGKSMKMINLRYLISVFHSNHLPAFMLDFMYFLGKNHIVFTATSSEQWSQS